MKEYAAASTSAAMSTASDSDITIPSLIHMNGYTATIAAAINPTAVPAIRRPR